VHPGDLVIVVSFCWLESHEVKNHSPRVVLVDEKNREAKSA
jgi:aspartate 1-decarboxylase